MPRLFEASSVGYRIEHKFYLSLTEAALLKKRLDPIMQRDPHSDANRCYLITSVYFDTPDARSYFGAQAGLKQRKKLRMRIYNHSDSYISLEYKERNGKLSRKRQLRITRADCDALLAGDPSPLLAYDNDVARLFYYDMKTNGYRAATIVEYMRHIYTHPISRVRITLDTAIRGSAAVQSLFDPIALLPALPRDVVLLEVKYCHFLPSFISDLLPRNCLPAISNCKYARARAIQP